ncbi:GNAT family N-acetyltransferase [Alkalicoccobacillus plakortidis]|uniref:GNAT family N-acetyltransferase n=1 Tax=Alkalicoccobacillus plakortidis TaxID=444060 RepID=A0ABT0XQP2_9BACI|nr:GNAT family protein [Alkalicoccobacillus plakortidis]MCM2677564.1 GNAT family N-acetyltransferase [Alkalicoccobacillus plakortidis]
MHSTNISLREFRYDDWKAINQYARLASVSQYQAWRVQTEIDSQSYLVQLIQDSACEPRSRYAFAIIENETQFCIGSAELNIRDRHNRVGELAYILHPNYWGKGFATEAAKQMLSYGFSEQKLHRIFATCDPRNISSERVMQKVGMQKEGKLRENLLLDEGWRDSLIYSLLENEVNCF